MIVHILSLLLAVLHPYYVSVTELKHNAKAQTVEVSCRLFADDTELALKKLGGTRLDILNPASREQVNQLLIKYIPQHLKISVNGKTLALRYIGYELESEAIWCYFEASGVKSAKRIVITNDVLFAEHAEQINMLHVTVNGQRKSTKLDNPQSRAEFGF